MRAVQARMGVCTSDFCPVDPPPLTAAEAAAEAAAKAAAAAKAKAKEQAAKEAGHQFGAQPSPVDAPPRTGAPPKAEQVAVHRGQVVRLLDSESTVDRFGESGEWQYVAALPWSSDTSPGAEDGAGGGGETVTVAGWVPAGILLAASPPRCSTADLGRKGSSVAGGSTATIASSSESTRVSSIFTME